VNLGGGESGKSTIVKQMKIIHQNGYTKEELTTYRPGIYKNIAEGAQSLVGAIKKFEIQWENPLCKVYLIWPSVNQPTVINRPCFVGICREHMCNLLRSRFCQDKSRNRKTNTSDMARCCGKTVPGTASPTVLPHGLGIIVSCFLTISVAFAHKVKASSTMLSVSVHRNTFPQKPMFYELV